MDPLEWYRNTHLRIRFNDFPPQHASRCEPAADHAHREVSSLDPLTYVAVAVLVVIARRSRVPSRWEQAFWARFDAQRATLERAA
jgi:hypothetical protein